MKYVPPHNGDMEDPDRPYVDADPENGIEGSRPPAAAIEHPQREIVNAITAAGVLPDENDTTQLAKVIGIGGRLRRITKFSADGNYAKPSWLKFAIVEGVGAGAGGGRAQGGADTAVGSGGGAGGPFRFMIVAAALLEEEAVVIGVGGLGGQTASESGQDGGDTSFGAHALGTGGKGGSSSGNTNGTSHQNGGAGGSTEYGVDAIPLLPAGENTGEYGRAGLKNSNILVAPGGGANSLYGPGGQAFVGATAGEDSGGDGVGYGAGGAGSRVVNTQPAASVGGNGKDGIIIVFEFD